MLDREALGARELPEKSLNACQLYKQSLSHGPFFVQDTIVMLSRTHQLCHMQPLTELVANHMCRQHLLCTMQITGLTH